MLLPMILVRDQIRNMLGGETGRITFGRIKYKYRTWINNNSSLCTIYWYVERVQKSSCCKVYDSICRAEGFGLLLAKGCDRIAALTPVNKNILWSFRHTSIGQLFMLDQGCGLEARPGWVRRKFLADTRASKLKGKYGNDNKEVYFVDEISNSAGHK